MRLLRSVAVDPAGSVVYCSRVEFFLKREKERGKRNGQ
jgi:hypothetical protein